MRKAVGLFDSAGFEGPVAFINAHLNGLTAAGIDQARHELLKLAVYTNGEASGWASGSPEGKI